MNRRNFFKAASAVVLGGMVGAQAKNAAPTYEWDLGELTELPLLPNDELSGKRTWCAAYQSPEDIAVMVNREMMRMLMEIRA